MKIERRGGQELSRWQMRDLSLLCLPDSSMWPELVARRKDKRECTVYLLKPDPVGSEGRAIMGWALVYPTPNLGGHDFHVYVHETLRRQGHGAALHAAAVQDHGVVRTFAPDDTARFFYRKVQGE